MYIHSIFFTQLNLKHQVLTQFQSNQGRNSSKTNQATENVIRLLMEANNILSNLVSK